MKITVIEYNLILFLREQQHIISLNADILNCCEAKWHGDIPIDILAQDIYRFAAEDTKQSLFKKLDEIAKEQRQSMSVEIAKIWWDTFWHPKSMTSIDFNDAKDALKQNIPIIDVSKKYGVVVNLATTKQVSDIWQMFKTMHDYTLPKGLMIHGMSCSNLSEHWFDFHWDLVNSNRYIFMIIYVEPNPLKFTLLDSRESAIELAKNDQIRDSLVYTIMRKPVEEDEFQIPNGEV
ncbi:hypothetical protein [Candidatus Trichorickettsia mobilis]|jgi:hypothetical protein|uniref:hypothetical protein n=1 Tax=Candidatus Trichorickettsia mobilis TaxID=1346319 RepID=UPI00292D1587|nr:hypothetical protein [Candidatus Trichorickettsia mobilis]